MDTTQMHEVPRTGSAIDRFVKAVLQALGNFAKSIEALFRRRPAAHA
jgi:hypothetical protein